MIQLFAVGEPAILQSLDAPIDFWNAAIIVLSVKWMEHPNDIHGHPAEATFAYEIDVRDGYFAQSALRKLDEPTIEIKEQTAEPIYEHVPN